MGLHCPGSRLDLFIGRIQLAIADIVCDSPAEQEAVLQHHTHLRADGPVVHLGDIDPIDPHRT